MAREGGRTESWAWRAFEDDARAQKELADLKTAVTTRHSLVELDWLGAVTGRRPAEVHLDASLFRSTVVARPRIDLYAEHRKFGYHLRGGDSEVLHRVGGGVRVRVRVRVSQVVEPARR